VVIIWGQRSCPQMPIIRVDCGSRVALQPRLRKNQTASSSHPRLEYRAPPAARRLAMLGLRTQNDMPIPARSASNPDARAAHVVPHRILREFS